VQGTRIKFARYGMIGQERPAIVDAAGRLRDTSALVAGDEIVPSVTGLGQQRQRIVAAR
jgi:hypothetical protein